MKFYLAPLEAITGYIFRNAYKEYFGDADKYFTPFIKGKRLSNKEKKDVNPENNAGMQIVPQILTNKAADLISLAEQIKDEYGYNCINLNLGCPAGTVVSKKRGAGFLTDLVALESFLDEVFLKCPIKISIKTRIGVEDIGEWEPIFRLFNKYPLEELIIHPRLQKEFYRGVPHLGVFEEIKNISVHSLCYNGDIKTKEDYENIRLRFPDLDKIMIGRGVLANPGLIGELKGKERMSMELFRDFHDKVYRDYKEVMSGDLNTLFKMKELWIYFIENFPESEKVLKKIRKAQKFPEYDAAVREIFFGNFL